MTAPDHYALMDGYDALDVMRASMTPERFEGFLQGNVLKYAMRLGRKGDAAEDAAKLADYAVRLKNEMQGAI